MSKETVFVCIRGMTRGSVWKVGGCMMVNSSTIRTSALQHFKCFYPKCALEVMLMAKTDNQLFILRHCMLANALIHMAKSLHMIWIQYHSWSVIFCIFFFASGLVVIWHWKGGGTEIFVVL